MDCREAEKKLIKLAEGLLTADEEDALREHVNHCPGCAGLVLAERLLADDIEQIRSSQPLSPMTVRQIREGIAIRERNLKNTNLGVRIMRQVSDTIYTRPRLSAAAATAFIILLASVLVPIMTEHPAGYEVVFAAPLSNLTLNQEKAEQLLAALDLDDARVEVTDADSGVEYKIAPLEDSAQVRKLIIVLDSLGSRRVRSSVSPTKFKDRTIWQLLLKEAGDDAGMSHPPHLTDKSRRAITLNLKKMLKGDFVLWMPVGGRSGDSLRGLLLDRQGEKTNVQIVGETGGLAPDDCGWHQYLNNSVMRTKTPDGKQVTFNLTDIDDVRRLEKLGYNFVTMEFDTPGQIPIPGMGPKLNEIKPNPFAEMATIEYMIPQAYEVKLQILDGRGREIRTLLDCMPLAGIRHVAWDGLDAEGNRVEPGTYLCRFTAGDYEETQEVTFMRQP